MSWILYVLLVLAVVGDILLAVVLAKVMHKNDEPQQKIDTADDFVRAVTPVLQSETDLLAEQLRAMQGESARTTTATLRDFSAVLAENQRQNAAASTARLESIDRAGAARQKAANDALLAQLTMMETRLKNLEDSNATRMDSVRGALVQGLNTIRADNNKKLDEIRGTVEEKLQDTLQQRINDSFKTVSAQLEQVYKGLGEMSYQELWETTMDPTTRTLRRITLDDAVKADATFTVLMGEKVEPRKEFIERKAQYAVNLDY